MCTAATGATAANANKTFTKTTKMVANETIPGMQSDEDGRSIGEHENATKSLSMGQRGPPGSDYRFAYFSAKHVKEHFRFSP